MTSMAARSLSMTIWLGLLVLLSSAWFTRASGGPDDVKRRLAAQLLKDGKAADAAVLSEEIAASSDARPSDFLELGKAYERLNRTRDAVSAYRHALRLSTPAPPDVRTEVEKRIKQLDPLAEKTAAAGDDFLRTLDGLEREAIRSRDLIAIEQIFRLRGNVWRALDLPGRAYCEVPANSNQWQDAGITVVAHQSYHVRAAGTWRVLGKGADHVECGPNGTALRPENSRGRMGELIAEVGGTFYPLGEEADFTPTISGPLRLNENEDDLTARAKNSGVVQVLISRK
jgi:tetratricopeptide (TPR) repeat protein